MGFLGFGVVGFGWVSGVAFHCLGISSHAAWFGQWCCARDETLGSRFAVYCGFDDFGFRVQGLGFSA